MKPKNLSDTKNRNSLAIWFQMIELKVLVICQKKYSRIGCYSRLITPKAGPERKHGYRKHHNKSFHDHVIVNFWKDIYCKSGFRIFLFYHNSKQ